MEITPHIKAALRTDLDREGYQKVCERLNNPEVARLLHIGMGLATESAEFVDQLKKHIFYGKRLDIVNLIEELGDITWYFRLALNELHITQDQVTNLNIAKLRLRYPEKFDERLAEHRDLDAERAVLEAV